MAVKRRVIRMFPDYGNPWPLWESGGEIYDPEPSQLGLSDELATAMREWYDFWDLHFHYYDGWDSFENEVRSLREGDAIVKRLREEVAPFADVVDRRYGRGGSCLRRGRGSSSGGLRIASPTAGDCDRG